MGGNRQRALLFLLLAIAAYARLTNLGGVYLPQGIFLGGVDSYYHARRMQVLVENFPKVPLHDPYMNAPQGLDVDWFIGFDLALSWSAKLVGAIFPTAELHVAVFFGPVLGVLACLLAFSLARRLFDPVVGLLTAGLMALTPLLTGYAIVGRVDHHAAEPLLLMTTLWAAMTLRQRVSTGHHRIWLAAVGVGASLALSIIVWSGALVLAVFFSVGVVVESLRAKPVQGRSQALAGSYALVATALISLSLLLALQTRADVGSFVYYALSWLHPLLLGVAACGLAVLGITRARGRLLALGAAVCTGLSLLLLSALLFDGLGRTLGDGLAYLSRSEAQIAQVSESMPLFTGGQAFRQYGWPLALAPFVLIGFPFLLRRNGRWQGDALWQPYLWLLAAAPLAVLQLRLGSFFAPLLALFTAAAVVWAQRRIAETFAGRASRRYALPLLLLVASLPTLLLHRPVAISGTSALPDCFDALEFLRRDAPAEKTAFAPEHRPAFTTLARWQWGHWLSYFSMQANVANPLGQAPAALAGVHDSIDFFLAPSSQPAMEILRRRRVRYVMSMPMLSELASLLRQRGRLPEEMLKKEGGGQRVAAAFFSSMQGRLYHYDGRRFRIAESLVHPLRRLRLVYECRATKVVLGRPLAACKIHQHVAGAQLRGTANAGERVALRIALRTNQRRAMVYRDQVQTDANGHYRFEVPYASGRNGEVLAGAAQIESTKGTSEVQISESAVIEGGVIDVPPMR